MSRRDTADGGTHANRKKSRNALRVKTPSKPKRNCGKKRGARSMGRYPFLTMSEKYLNLCTGNMAISTLNTRRRALCMTHDDLQVLKAAGKIESCSPTKLTSEDIVVLVGHWRQRGVSESSVRKYVNTLDQFLQYCKNPAVSSARLEYRPLMPNTPDPTYDPLDSQTTDLIYECSRIADRKDWILMVSYALTISALTIGARLNELRNIKTLDLDLKNHTVRLTEVKGKGKYGKPRLAYIHPDGWEFLEEYVILRQEHLLNEGIHSQYLFPAVSKIMTGDDTALSENSVRLRKELVIEHIYKTKGVKLSFDFRACRRTYGQSLKNAGIPIEAVSIVMGHRTTRTTERYYARLSATDALATLGATFSAQRIPSPVSESMASAAEIQSLLIELKNLISGS